MPVFVRFMWGLLALALWSAPSASGLSQEAPIEQKVKAAYLYNFVRFVEWPKAPAGTPVTVGVVGTEKLATEMKEALDGRAVGDRPLVVSRVTNVDDAARHNVLYVAGNDLDMARRYVAPTVSKPILTVTECDRFLKAGSLVNFYLADDSVRFAVSSEALDRSPLKVSSQMLQFASIVKPEAP